VLPGGDPFMNTDLAGLVGLVAAKATRRTRAGSKPTDIAVLLRIASAYDRALTTNPRAPIVAASKTLGVSETVVRDLVHRARTRNLLPWVGQGRTGGGLTPKGRELLAAQSAASRRRKKTR
jgi:hypothetical protein